MICMSRLQAIRRSTMNRRIVVRRRTSGHERVKADGPLRPTIVAAGGTIGGTLPRIGRSAHAPIRDDQSRPGRRARLPSGEVVRLGESEDRPDTTLGVVVGPEGTFGIVTRATHSRATPSRTDARRPIDRGGERDRSGIIAAGIVPAAPGMMDWLIVGGRAAYRIGLLTDAGRLWSARRPGCRCADQLAQVATVTARMAPELRVARATRSARRWKSRKRAFGAVGRLAPNYCTQDGVVPRTRVPDILRAIQQSAAKHRIRAGNVFHAGDGNIHPILLFDERDRDEVARVLAAGREILEACIALGGSVTGEHGIGVEKIAQMPLLFAPDDLLAMTRLRAVFDPEGRANPHKIFPDAKVCVETRTPRRQVPI
jgi:glycolate oxidase